MSLRLLAKKAPYNMNHTRFDSNNKPTESQGMLFGFHLCVVVVTKPFQLLSVTLLLALDDVTKRFLLS